jgi:hypothetical protein
MKDTRKSPSKDPMKLLTENSQAKKELLAGYYQKAFMAEKQQREATNIAIQELRKCERELRDAGQNYAEFDQLQTKLNVEETRKKLGI